MLQTQDGGAVLDRHTVFRQFLPVEKFREGFVEIFLKIIE